MGYALNDSAEQPFLLFSPDFWLLYLSFPAGLTTINAGFFMNIYLCSTVRHLLFSLLKALSEPELNSRIFMICDQQNIDKDNFDTSCLPKNVEVIFIERKQIRKELYSGVKGKIIKLMANFNVKTSEVTRKKIGHLLFNETLHSPMTHEQLTSGQLFLFNDRNKMSRLFRLAFKQYSLIEEGLSNYSGIKLKPLEKLNALINKNNKKMRYFGDDCRCQYIYLINAEKAPSALTHKVKQIDFIQAKTITLYCNDFFKVPNSSKACSYLLATQPLAEKNIDMIIYKKIINVCNDRNIAIAIKPHPREEISRYISAFPNISVLDSKLPLELIIFGQEQKCNILSISSAAGMGFEKYCNRNNIIKDNEIEELKTHLDNWQSDLSLIDIRINALFSEIK